MANFMIIKQKTTRNRKGFGLFALGGSSNSQFEPANKNSNQRRFLQSAQPYGSKSRFENGANAPEFEPIHKNSNHIEFVDYIHIHKVNNI